ncbi:MAG: hypothetical protein O7F75_00405 [Alphaproteobacteria bacterium]|nr:hypothetical protein [Alphaproteobacteria bacterium]
MITKTIALAAAVLMAGGIASDASAQSVAKFYKGKKIRMVVGSTAGGGYGTYARVLGNYMTQYIPGKPRILVQFRPGAGSVVATNWLYNVGPRDGTAMASIQRAIPMLPLLGQRGPKYDALKFNWIGSLNNEVSICVSWHTSGIKTIQDVMKKELIIGGAGPNDTEQFPSALNNILGTKFKIISGYSGTGITLAMERGEVYGRCGWSWTSFNNQRPTWLKEKKVNILIQLTLKGLPEIGNVPVVIDLAKNPKDKAVLELIFARQALGRPYVMPPDVPADRLAAIRKAFMATARDPKFVAQMKKLRFNVSPVSGEEMQNIIIKIYKTPPDIVALTKDAIVYRGTLIKAKIKLVKHTGKVTKTKRGGRRIFISYKGKEVKAKVSGRRTKVTIGGKKAKRKAIKVGMTCTFTYPGAGQEAKKIDCK